jgi:sugar lactone lactonase YvrE
LLNVSAVSTYPYALFIDTNNAVYVAETTNNRIQIFPQGSAIATRTLSSGLNAPHAVCATANDNIYVNNGNNVDTNNTLYCSLNGYQRVLAVSLNGTLYTPVTVARTGVLGSGSYQFTYPNGIVVDLNFTLYVAD